MSPEKHSTGKPVLSCVLGLHVLKVPAAGDFLWFFLRNPNVRPTYNGELFELPCGY